MSHGHVSHQHELFLMNTFQRKLQGHVSHQHELFLMNTFQRNTMSHY